MLNKILNSRKILVFIIPFLLGSLSVFSFQPFNITLINFLIFPIFFLILSNINKRSKNKYRKKPYLKNLFFVGYFFGIGFFLSGTYWISYSLTFDENLGVLIPFSIILIPRLFYIFINFNINKTPDSHFYIDIAENISKGCGFSFTNSLGGCSEIFGGYFPGYPIFIYTSKLIGIGYDFIPILSTILNLIAYIYFFWTLKSYGMKGKKFLLLVTLISLSPISIGFSRYILIEPLLYSLSIFLLTEFLKLVHYFLCRTLNKNLNFLMCIHAHNKFSSSMVNFLITEEN